MARKLTDSLVVFLDPVQEINSSLSRFEVISNFYFARKKPIPSLLSEVGERKGNKRKRVERDLSEKEVCSRTRHEALAHLAKLAYGDCKDIMNTVSRAHDEKSSSESSQRSEELDFISLMGNPESENVSICLPSSADGGVCSSPLFGTILANRSDREVIASVMGHFYLVPKLASFMISDVCHLGRLVPDCQADGFNLLLIDPPWENRSVKRHAMYPTMPNRSLFALPVKKLCHAEGALVALWVTNREKLLQFVEKELFPFWGVKHTATWIWLKVTAEGFPISPFENPHHRPYELLLLGYVPPKQGCLLFEGASPLPDNYVIISTPGEHSRKPPIGNALQRFAPKVSTPNALELFARELTAGWTSWGNEALKFQDLQYFTTPHKD